MQDALKLKTEAKRLRDMNKYEEAFANYMLANKTARKAVAKTKHKAYKDHYDSLAGDEVLSLAKQKDRVTRCIPEQISERWKWNSYI